MLTVVDIFIRNLLFKQNIFFESLKIFSGGTEMLKFYETISVNAIFSNK